MTPFPPDSYRDFPKRGRSRIILSPLGETGKGVKQRIMEITFGPIWK